MSKLILVRHGQASFGKSNYDKLSELGHQQSRWLGEYLGESQSRPSLIVTGSLVRHRETATGILTGLGNEVPVLEIPEWNEFDFTGLVANYLTQHPNERPEENHAKAYFSLLKKALLSWSDGQLTGSFPESWQGFEDRVKHALDKTSSAHQDGSTLVVTSGGTISMVLKLILELSPATMIDLNLQTRNTAVTEIFFNAHKRYLSSFNNLPHMLTSERQASITYA